MAGVTFDSGVLIGLERADRSAQGWYGVTIGRGMTPRVPAVVVAETWRGGARAARLARALAACAITETDERIARVAGELLGVTRSANTIDALVVATAARFGDAVLTADPDDLAPLVAALGVGLLVL